MHRILLLVAILLAPLARSEAQVRSFSFFGSDGGRSQHLVRIELTPDGLGNSSLVAYGSSTFFDPGQFRECTSNCTWVTSSTSSFICATGCAWTVDWPMGAFIGVPDDTFHAADFCSNTSPPLTPTAPFGRYCTGLVNWVGGGFRVRGETWEPTSVSVSLRYSDLSTRILILTPVPEPGSTALLAAGVAIGALVLRRRTQSDRTRAR